MIDSPYLQSVVSPICRCTRQGNAFQIERLHGTGFLVGSSGIFLTANHVLQNAAADVKANGGEIGIFPMQHIDGKQKSLNVIIGEFESAPEPFDVAIFENPQYVAKTPFRFRRTEVQVWQDVATMGYPESVVNKTVDGVFELQQRVHKGYVQRKIPVRRLSPGTNPACFELSFAITSGLSGSPLFTHAGKTDELIGICIASHQSRVVQYEHRSYADDKENFHEIVERVEEFGIAHDLSSLLDWKPKCLNGKSLGEVQAT